MESFLPSYDISKMDLYHPADKREIIVAILNRGNMEDVKWLFRIYTIRDIKRVLEDPGRGIWYKDSFDFWLKVFNIKLPKIIYEVAIFSLKHRPKLIMRYFNYLKRKGKIPKKTLKRWEEIDKLEKVRK